MTPKPRPHPAWVSAYFTLPELLRCLDVSMGEGGTEVEVESLSSSHGGVLGAQLLGQSVSACEAATPGKAVVRLSLSFLRPSRWETPVRVVLRHLSNGRRYAVVEVDFEQRGKLIARGEAMLGVAADTTEPSGLDVAVPGTATTYSLWPWEAWDPAGDPASGEVWSRISVQTLTPRASRALLAYATEPLTVPLFIDQQDLRDRGGDIPQAVLAHSITFTAPFDARRWHLHRPEIAGRSGPVVTGRGVVRDGSGRCVATTETVASIEL